MSWLIFILGMTVGVAVGFYFATLLSANDDEFDDGWDMK